MVESKLGEGSVFTVELTFSIPDVSEEQVEDTDNTIDENVLDGLLFLVAEDIELNAEILSEMLAIEGAKCEFAVNGEEAVEMFTKSEPGHYDMILMDVQMPIMNGHLSKPVDMDAVKKAVGRLLGNKLFL